MATYALPLLPYAYDALEPSISAEIMTLHHTKHHQTYVTNLNTALAALTSALTTFDIPTQVSLQSAIKFNGGGHINHSLFWENLAPTDSPTTRVTVAPELTKKIAETWGGIEEFKKVFEGALLGIQGSGWGWLAKGKTGNLQIITTKDQDPVVGDEVPIFGVDMWEHAYYLQYQNGKAAYVKNIWAVLNWETSEKRYLGTKKDAFKVLRASVAKS